MLIKNYGEIVAQAFLLGRTVPDKDPGFVQHDVSVGLPYNPREDQTIIDAFCDIAASNSLELTPVDGEDGFRTKRPTQPGEYGRAYSITREVYKTTAYLAMMDINELRKELNTVISLQFVFHEDDLKRILEDLASSFVMPPRATGNVSEQKPEQALS